MSVEEIPSGAEVSVFSKNEKKARKLFSKLSLKKIDSISRVTFKRKGNQVYAIDHPEVYRSAAGTYIVFGEAKLENLAERYKQAAEAQSKLKDSSPETLKNAAESVQAGEGLADKSPASITADLQAASLEDKKEEEVVEGDVDETGIDADDIQIVVDQTNVSRAKAVKALRDNNNDMVNAIMSLS